MKKDIPQPKVEELAVAIVPREDAPTNPEEDLWDVWIVNLRADTIKNVMVVSRGYGKMGEETRKTSTLRYFMEEITGETAMKIEPIQHTLFELTNEYWISFNYNGHMYDKKYIFVKGSIEKKHLTKIPVLDQQGVMIR